MKLSQCTHNSKDHAADVGVLARAGTSSMVSTWIEIQTVWMSGDACMEIE